jgi:hypothetical protein
MSSKKPLLLLNSLLARAFLSPQLNLRTFPLLLIHVYYPFRNRYIVTRLWALPAQNKSVRKQF